MGYTVIDNIGINISIWATVHLPLPNPTLTLTCCQLTVVELGEGWVGSQLDTDIEPNINLILIIEKGQRELIGNESMCSGPTCCGTGHVIIYSCNSHYQFSKKDTV